MSIYLSICFYLSIYLSINIYIYIYIYIYNIHKCKKYTFHSVLISNFSFLIKLLVIENSHRQRKDGGSGARVSLLFLKKHLPVDFFNVILLQVNTRDIHETFVLSLSKFPQRVLLRLGKIFCFLLRVSCFFCFCFFNRATKLNLLHFIQERTFYLT